MNQEKNQEEQRFLELVTEALSCPVCGHMGGEMLLLGEEELGQRVEFFRLRRSVSEVWKNLWYHTGGTTYPHVAFVHAKCVAEAS